MVGARRNIDLLNGWRNFGGEFEVATYNVIGGVCYLQGLITRDSIPSNCTIAQLPEGYRPTARLVFTSSNHGFDTSGGSHRIDIKANGEVIYIGGNIIHRWTSLSGISFLVA